MKFSADNHSNNLVTVRTPWSDVGKKLDFRVHIFKTTRAMRMYMAECYGESCGISKKYARRTLGLCLAGSLEGRDGEPSPEAFTLFLSAQAMGSGYAAHELMHAALYIMYERHPKLVKAMRHYVRPRGQDGVKSACATEEHFCNLFEEMTRSVWEIWYKDCAPKGWGKRKNRKEG